ncbi:hypothetical protein CP532_1535 [Ophiocordyceps camponoti-leonardi (nom. inval.)]|nr:hypothetical protein CP532_1535 [Ophiocordyceps camponoti-leonardi (nom. inval.)]
MKSLADRTIRVLVSPTPITFAERRAVLHVLEKHGAVQMFRMTPNYQSNYISVTRDAETVERLVRSSPISYQLPPSSTASSSPSAFSPSSAFSSADNAADVNRFRLDIFRQPDFQHGKSMRRVPTRHSWPPMWQKDHSLMATTLRQSLPPTMAARGLAHWFLPFHKAPTVYKAWRLSLRKWLPSLMAAAEKR